MTISSAKKIRQPIVSRRGGGPQRIGTHNKTNAIQKSRLLSFIPAPGLRLPRLTTARGVRRAHGRLCEWVLAGLLDSIVATRLSYILENIRKAIELEQLADLQTKLNELKAEGARYGINVPALGFIQDAIDEATPAPSDDLVVPERQGVGSGEGP